MPDAPVTRKLAAILSADVQGYSRLMGDDEVATIRTLTEYREVMTQLIEQHQGRVVDSPGDNLLAEFGSAVDAVEGAVAIQQALQKKNAELADDRQMRYRIGINVGDVVVEAERIYGDGVNIAARLENLAEGGGISISGTVYDQVKNKLDLGYTYQGEQQVKNIAEPVRMYTVQHGPEGRRAILPSTAHVQPGWWRSLSIGIAAFLLLGFGLLGWRLMSDDSGTSVKIEQESTNLPLPDKPSIAVLPFTNMGGDPEQEYFSDGMTEDLITDLSKISGLLVIARNSTFTYKGKTVNITEVGRELGVHYVLEGSVRRAGDRVRITAQLIDASTSLHVWADRYDRQWTDIFSVQDDITQKVVFALKVTLTPEEQERFQRAPTDNLEAYDLFLQGEVYANRFQQEENTQARQLFERAIELDPNYAAAHARLGMSYVQAWQAQWLPGSQPLERARTIALRAVDLDDSLALPHLVLGQVSLWQGRFEEAIAETERAIALDPNNAEAHAALGNILNFADRADEAFAPLEKAIRLNPNYPYYYLNYMGQAYCFTSQNEKAIVMQKKALARNPQFAFAHFCMAACSMHLGREQEARAQLQEGLKNLPNFSPRLMVQLFPNKEHRSLKRMLSALRKAGLE